MIYLTFQQNKLKSIIEIGLGSVSEADFLK